MVILMGTPTGAARGLFSILAPASARGNLEGQLVPGQWVEVSIERLPTPVLLNGFVLSLRPSEVLLTFPELLEPPEELESEAQASVHYSNASGSFVAMGIIVRVASGPPVTVTFKRLVPAGSEPRRPQVRSPAVFPVSLHIVCSRVEPPDGLDGISGMVQEVSDSAMLLKTSVLLAVGDRVRLVPRDEPDPVGVQGRVVRVFEDEGKGQFGVGIELIFKDDEERERWLRFAARWR
jgi:hypothetical protein